MDKFKAEIWLFFNDFASTINCNRNVNKSFLFISDYVDSLIRKCGVLSIGEG